MTELAKSVARAIGAGARDADRSLLLAGLLAGLSALAWSTLWLWNASPYGRYLEHGGWGDAGALAALCRALPQGDIIVPAVPMPGAVLMIAAMMLRRRFRCLRSSAALLKGVDARLAALVVSGFLPRGSRSGSRRMQQMRCSTSPDHDRRRYLTSAGRSAPRLWPAPASSSSARSLVPGNAHTVRVRCLALAAALHARGVAARRRPRRVLRRCCWALMLLMFVVNRAASGGCWCWPRSWPRSLPWGRRLRTPLASDCSAGPASSRSLTCSGSPETVAAIRCPIRLPRGRYSPARRPGGPGALLHRRQSLGVRQVGARLRPHSPPRGQCGPVRAFPHVRAPASRRGRESGRRSVE